jgi:hypothetical protein
MFAKYAAMAEMCGAAIDVPDKYVCELYVIQPTWGLSAHVE